MRGRTHSLTTLLIHAGVTLDAAPPRSSRRFFTHSLIKAQPQEKNTRVVARLCAHTLQRPPWSPGRWERVLLLCPGLRPCLLARQQDCGEQLGNWGSPAPRLPSHPRTPWAGRGGSVASQPWAVMGQGWLEVRCCHCREGVGPSAVARLAPSPTVASPPPIQLSVARPDTPVVPRLPVGTLFGVHGVHLDVVPGGVLHVLRHQHLVPQRLTLPAGGHRDRSGGQPPQFQPRLVGDGQRGAPGVWRLGSSAAQSCGSEAAGWCAHSPHAAPSRASRGYFNAPPQGEGAAAITPQA